jgi:hypothetical protein
MIHRQCSGFVARENNPAPLVRQHQEYAEDLNPNGGDRKEIYGNEALQMIVPERAPGL